MNRNGARRGPPLGAHMSVRGGLDRAIARAADVDGAALQVFVAGTRQWRARPLDEEEVRRFRRALRRSGLRPFTLAHACYLINLAAAARDLRRRSVAALVGEIERCARLGIPQLVLHPGAHGGDGADAGIDRIASGLDEALAATRGSRVTALLENTAGQGTALGARFEELGRIVARSARGRRLGVCFDTCHAFAAGYEFRDRRSYRRTFAAFDRAVGIGRLRALHLNDSRGALGSRVDRHAPIGAGELGLEPFRLLLADRRFRGLPMVLETPKGEDLAEDRRNLAVLRAMLPRSRRR